MVDGESPVQVPFVLLGFCGWVEKHLLMTSSETEVQQVVTCII